MSELLAKSTVYPAVNQIRLHPYNYAEQLPIMTFCATHSPPIKIEAYSSLSSLTKEEYKGGPVDKVVRDIATRMQVSESQVLLKWVRQKGAIIVTTSSKKSRLEEYLAVEDLREYIVGLHA